MLLRAVIRSVFVVLAFVVASSARAQELLPLQVPPPTSEAPSENPVDAQLVAPPPSASGKSALEERLKEDPAFRKDLEGFMESYIKKRESEKKKAEEEKKNAEAIQKQQESISPTGWHDRYMNLPILYDSVHPFPDPTKKPSKWYDKMSIRGYTQIRFDRTLETEPGSAEPNVFGDRGINGRAENFIIRRLRFIFSGELNDHLFFYIQPDFGSTVQGVTGSTFFGQMRDAYADVYVDTEQVHRFRVGLSKVPYGFENLQSSQNRIPLDRTDTLNTAVAPNERDVGVIYYWTPEDKQKLLKALVDSGLKGSGNYGIFGVGFYNGQGGAVPEANLNLHTVARLTWPMQLNWSNGQVIETSIQGYRGDYVVTGAEIRPLGEGRAITPRNTGGSRGILEERVAGTFVFYPQPIGFQAEWQTGKGPGLNDEQTSVIRRSIGGGYLMTMYRYDSESVGVFIPYVRYQQFTGGYRNVQNAPYGHQRQVDIGLEWQIFKELELTCEYSVVNTPNFSPRSGAGQLSFNEFEGSLFRVQFQFNY